MTEQDGDQVLWRGEPDKHFFIERSDWLVAVAGVAWIAVNGWLIMAYFANLSFIAAVRVEWRAGWLIVGAALTLGHPLIRGAALLNTRYTITEREVIVAVGGLRPKVYVQPYDLLLPPVVRHHGDEAGSIAFGEFPRSWETLAAVVGRGPTSSMIVLRHVWPVDEVLALITSRRDQAWAATG
ncbi:hypothetical protein AB0B31_16540 [Catellatospora citrea]|uniref:hypothetical protein n=1 Tax=Catellatospora citrea TaxID=53366 RepID=UPI00340CF212